MRASRGGLTLKTGKIGRVNCLRQQLMMPGERMNISINGKVRLEALRERDVMRINAHLATFMVPLRWVWPEFPDYLKQGPDTAITPSLVSGDTNWSTLGIGSYATPASTQYYEFFRDAYLRVYNEWYKWPEDNDNTSANIGDHGCKAVPLSKTWTRCRYDATPDASADYTVSAATDFDVRDLAEVQAKFRSAMKRDVLSYKRYMELVDQTYHGDASREVDQVPIMLEQVEVGVDPREAFATDTPGLGEEWMSLFNFNVNHQIRGVTAPEHCIILHMLTLRFAGVAETCMPLANAQLDWHELTGDPEFLASAQPREVLIKDVMQINSATSLGYLPAGWQWRADHDVIGKSIDIRDSFPYMLLPATQAEAKDATRVKNAFRTTALDDYMVDIFFKEDSIQPIGDSMDSYMSGMYEDSQVKPGGRGDEFPHGGKML